MRGSPVFVCGTRTAIHTIERKAKDLLTQADAYRELSSSLTFDDLGSASSGS